MEEAAVFLAVPAAAANPHREDVRELQSKEIREGILTAAEEEPAEPEACLMAMEERV